MNDPYSTEFLQQFQWNLQRTIWTESVNTHCPVTYRSMLEWPIMQLDTRHWCVTCRSMHVLNWPVANIAIGPNSFYINTYFSKQYEQERKSLKSSAFSIMYVTNKEYVANKVFVINQVFIDNNVFVWKFTWQYLGSDKSSICLKDQLTKLGHHNLNYLSPIKKVLQSSIYLSGQMTLLWLVSASLKHKLNISKM